MNKYITYKDRLNRLKIFKNKYNKYSLKYLSLKENLDWNIKFKTMLKMQLLLKSTLVKKRCTYTSYPRAILTYSKSSKSEFKRFMGLALLTGFTKASW